MPTTKTWFTSDLHFDHRNIIAYCRRPFASVEEMNAGLIANWNAVVGPEDEVYVVGDFALHSKAPRLDGFLVQLRGHKHLVRGNHDDRKVLKKLRGWTSVELTRELVVDGVKLRLSHFKLEDWRGLRILLHGHSHGPRSRTGPFSFDVGVDPNGYRPVTISQLLKEE